VCPYLVLHAMLLEDVGRLEYCELLDVCGKCNSGTMEMLVQLKQCAIQ